jgi:hypothetical protein
MIRHKPPHPLSGRVRAKLHDAVAERREACYGCGGPFTHANSRTYCSDACRKLNHNRLPDVPDNRTPCETCEMLRPIDRPCACCAIEESGGNLSDRRKLA